MLFVVSVFLERNGFTIYIWGSMMFRSIERNFA